MSIESMVPFNHLILCRPLLFLPSIFPSIRIFSNESALRIRLPKCWSFSYSINLSNGYSGLISVKIDSSDLHSVQGAPRSLLQHHNLKAPVLQCSAFFMVQLSHLYMTTGNTISWRVNLTSMEIQERSKRTTPEFSLQWQSSADLSGVRSYPFDISTKQSLHKIQGWAGSSCALYACWRIEFWKTAKLCILQFSPLRDWCSGGSLQEGLAGDFPGSPMIKNLPPNAGDVGSIPDHRTINKIPLAMGRLSLNYWACIL